MEEQITKNITEESEESQVKSPKDPRKVAAGKALARKNLEARNLFKNKKIDSKEEIQSIDFSSIYNGITLAAGLVGAGFTLYHGWKFYESFEVAEIPQSPRVNEPIPETNKNKKIPKL